MKREFDITFSLCRNNVPGCLAVFMGGLLPRIEIAPLPLSTGIEAFLRVVVTCLVWDYVIDIANTSTSVEEDKLNKPYRPIPSGLITLGQSNTRWAVSWCIAPWVVAFIGGKKGALYIILWQIWVGVFYVWPAYRHWLTKNVMTTGATLMMLRLLNSILQGIPNWEMSVLPDILICGWMMATIHLQDFRDIEGDRITHAITLPIFLSDKGKMRLRAMTAFFLMVGNIGSALWIWMRDLHYSGYHSGALLYLSSTFLSFYTVTSTSRHQDRIMYRWWMATSFCVIYHIYYLHLLETTSQMNSRWAV